MIKVVCLFDEHTCPPLDCNFQEAEDGPCLPPREPGTEQALNHVVPVNVYHGLPGLRKGFGL